MRNPYVVAGKGWCWEVSGIERSCAILQGRGRAVRCIDADPVNKTLFQYRALEAKPLQLLHDGAIDSRHDAAGYSQQPFRLSIGTGLEQTQ